MRNFTLQQEIGRWRLIINESFLTKEVVDSFKMKGGVINYAYHDKWEGITEEWVFPNSSIKEVVAIFLS